jgi:hypothetical protein
VHQKSKIMATSIVNYRKRLRGIGWAGFALLILLFIWIGFSIHNGVFAYPQRSVLNYGTAFEGSTALPESTIKAALKDATSKMLPANTVGYIFNVASNFAAWLSFLASAVIALVAGYCGTLLPSGEIKPEQLPELLKGRSQRYVHLIGVLAAFAAILTGVTNKASDEASKIFKAVDDVQIEIARTSDDIFAAKTEREAQAILNRLQIKVSRL